jgi:hypothetical protein
MMSKPFSPKPGALPTIEQMIQHATQPEAGPALLQGRDDQGNLLFVILVATPPLASVLAESLEQCGTLVGVSEYEALVPMARNYTPPQTH